MPSRYPFMGLSLAYANRAETLAAIASATNEAPVRIATPNGEFYLKAEKNEAFQKALEGMTHCTVDGSGPFFMLKIWTFLKNLPSPERYAGADLVADIFAAYQDGSKTFFFLGGPISRVEGAAAKVSLLYPHIEIVGIAEGGTIANDPDVREELLETIQSANPDVLLIGFGAPKQELWMHKASGALSIPTMIGIGGTFGFYTDKKRAGSLVRSLHMEWFFRLLREPGHGKRVWQAVVVFGWKSAVWMAANLFKRKEAPQP